MPGCNIHERPGCMCRSTRQLPGSHQAHPEPVQAAPSSTASEVQAAAMRADLARLKLQQAQAAMAAAAAQVNTWASKDT